MDILHQLLDLILHVDVHLSQFVQTYGGHDLDASLLMLPTVGFLPASS